MADVRVDQLNIYPIKSLGGVTVSDLDVGKFGPEIDRRWMLVDADGVCVTQRVNRILSQCRVKLSGSELVIEHGESVTSLPLTMDGGETIPVRVWDDTVRAIKGPDRAIEWFSDILGFRCSPVFMSDASVRRVDPAFAPEESFTTFTDGFPILVASNSSLADLNNRLNLPVPMSRFRPNLVVSGSEPFAEDTWGRVEVGTATIRGVKPCSRCVMTTIDPDTLLSGKEPLRTLATYRKWGHHVYFGENFVVETGGRISVGDHLNAMDNRSEIEVSRSRS
jgi:uncharacterized protein YcbX